MAEPWKGFRMCDLEMSFQDVIRWQKAKKALGWFFLFCVFKYHDVLVSNIFDFLWFFYTLSLVLICLRHGQLKLSWSSSTIQTILLFLKFTFLVFCLVFQESAAYLWIHLCCYWRSNLCARSNICKVCTFLSFVFGLSVLYCKVWVSWKHKFW